MSWSAGVPKMRSKRRAMGLTRGGRGGGFEVEGEVVGRGGWGEEEIGDGQVEGLGEGDDFVGVEVADPLGWWCSGALGGGEGWLWTSGPLGRVRGRRLGLG